ncbi:hypothetical protein ACXWTF_00220 [Thiomicrolovo sp. ZZH C-3]
MDKRRYYKAPSLFKGVGRVLKESFEQQARLNEAGLMIKTLTMQSQLMPTERLEGANFPQKQDLFLSGNGKPSYMRIRITVDAVTKE